MQKYKVLEYFRWGDLMLDKGQIVLVTTHNPQDNNSFKLSLISVEHYPNKNQVVATKAVESMVSLQKIAKY